MAADIEATILKQVARRFIPFLMLCYFVNYLDRVNVGFAKLTMSPDLGLSDPHVERAPEPEAKASE